MINVNGKIIAKSTYNLSLESRGFKYGDALFETLKVVQSKILFWEDHYFRLMSSMRILRMEIPMNFTMEFLESEIISTLKANSHLYNNVRVRLNVERKEGGKYRPITNDINYSIEVEKIESNFYSIDENQNYEVDLYKDYFINSGLLSNLKTNNKIINVLGSIFANENEIDNCLLLNTNKNVVEALNGNLFIVNDKIIKTPPLNEGCLKGVMRKQIIELIKQLNNYTVIEEKIAPFELQKADELFITNVILGIQPVLKYRKKKYNATVSQLLLHKLNARIK